MMSWVKVKLINWLTRKLLNSVRVEDVFTIDPKMNLVYLGGEQISATEARALAEEVKFIEDTHVWRVMENTLRQKAIDNGLTRSENFEHLLSAKTMLLNLDIQKNIMSAIRKYVSIIDKQNMV